MNLKKPSQQGFSLLEILIAFSILALSLGVLLNIFSSGLRRASISEEYQQAVTIAESVLATVGIEEKLETGTKSGSVLEKYHWTQDIRPFEDESIDPEAINLFPFRVTVTVTWEAGKNNRHIELVTLRLTGEPNES